MVNILTVVVMPAPNDAERLTPLAQVLEVDSGLRAGSEGRRDYTGRPPVAEFRPWQSDFHRTFIWRSPRLW